MQNANELLPRERNARLVKWLQVLFIVNIIKIICSSFSTVFSSIRVFDWIILIIPIGIIVVLFQLAPAHDRYKKAAIFQCIFLGCSLVGAFSSGIVVLAASVCSLISMYQEYSAHSEIINSLDANISRKWHSLFNWQIAVGVLSALALTATGIVAIFAEVLEAVAPVISAVLSLISIAMGILYLFYLQKTRALLQNQVFPV